jgi:hypothetical protein
MAVALPDRLRLSCSERLDVGRREGIAADSPVPTLDLLNNDPCHGSQRLPFDLNHRVGEPTDHIPLLALVEHSLNHLDIHQRHRGHLHE